MSAVLSPVEAKELLRLCASGRLYEVEAWIRAGRSIPVPKEVRKTPLRVALETGFHSLGELLLRHEPSQEGKNEALRQALWHDQPVFVELAVRHGADINSVPLIDVLMTGKRELAAFFLERGADPITGYPFAHAFHQLKAKTTLGSYLDCRRSRPELVDQLQQQLDMALRQFCQEGNLKWVSLLMWAGAAQRPMRAKKGKPSRSETAESGSASNINATPVTQHRIRTRRRTNLGATAPTISAAATTTGSGPLMAANDRPGTA
jgi:hypothetical protein